MAALARRWASTKHMQDMVQLLAKLVGEMTKDGAEASRRVSLIIIRGANFRQRVDALLALEARANREVH